MTWSASQYTEFENERTRPVRDLLAGIPDMAAKRAVDIGCGPANSTELLAARFPTADVTGLDSSPDMIAAARTRLPNLQFDLVDITSWGDHGPFDVILANAVLQWVPDHEHLFPNLASRLTPGGSLAVQMPDNLEEPAHRLMRQVATEGSWSSKLAGAAGSRTQMQSAAWYYERLRTVCSRVDVWRTTYYHNLAGGPAAIVEWFKGSGLRPFLQPLDAAEQAAYLSRYQAEIALAYPPLPDGSVLLPFPRLFLIATR
jgi:trans-aconitate 2-methyltransferase